MTSKADFLEMYLPEQAMQKYMEQELEAFTNWTISGECAYCAIDVDTWQDNETFEKYTTLELYKIFKSKQQ